MFLDVIKTPFEDIPVSVLLRSPRTPDNGSIPHTHTVDCTSVLNIVLTRPISQPRWQQMWNWQEFQDIKYIVIEVWVGLIFCPAKNKLFLLHFVLLSPAKSHKHDTSDFTFLHLLQQANRSAFSCCRIQLKSTENIQPCTCKPIIFNRQITFCTLKQNHM